ncbi:MAG: YceI family protein [Streptosporangiaceae bacterium]|nr:YceI family protein [Streptosporangiaceae bacterium]
MTRPAMAGGVASPVLPGDWVADPAACTLAFSVRNLGLRTVTGRIPLSSAVVSVGPSGEPVSIRAELDAGGIRTGNPRRDTDLRGRRFLATNRWPVITFEAGYIKPVQTGWTVSGTLTVKDTQCPVRLDVASFTIPADGQVAQVDLRAAGRLDRRSAGVTAGPAFLIGHLISLSLAVRLRRQAGPPQRRRSPT